MRCPPLVPRLALLVVLVIATASVGGCASKGEAELANEALQRGLQAHGAGNLVQAEKDYQEVLKHDPQNKYAYFDLGLIYQTQGRLPDAEAHYRIAIGIDPDFASALFNLAIIRAAAGFSAEAVDLYRRVIRADAMSAGAHFNLGLLLRSLGQKTEGDAEVRAAIRLDPSFLDPEASQRVPAPTAQPSASP